MDIKRLQTVETHNLKCKQTGAKKVHKGTQKYTKVRKGTIRYAKVHNVYKCTQM